MTWTEFSPWLPSLVSGLFAIIGGGMLVRARVQMRQIPPVAMPPSIQPPIDLNGALETLLVKAVSSQCDMMERIGHLNQENVKLAAETLMSGARRVGGKLRAKTGAKNAKGRYVNACRLCEDPNIFDPSAVEIMSHANHRPRARKRVQSSLFSAAKQLPDGVTVHDDHVEAHIDEAELIDEPHGAGQRVECAACLNGAGQHMHPVS